MMKNMQGRLSVRYFLTAYAALCILLMFMPQGLIADDSGEKNSGDPKLSQVRLQLTWLHQFQFAGYYAALEKGFYRDAGFDVTLTEGTPGRRPIEEVVSGRADFGVARGELLLHRLHGKPVVALAAIFQHSPVILLAKEESGIATPHDMIGKRVMLLEGDDAAEYIAIFRNEGISPDQIEVIPSTYNIDDLISGNTDVFNAYATNEPYYLERRGISMTLINPRTYGIDFYGDCLFTSEQKLRDAPGQVRAFREASLRGWEYAMENTEEIISLILRQYEARKTREHLRFEAEAIRGLVMPRLIQMGQMNPGRWRHMADTYVELEMADPDYSLKGFIYNPDISRDYTWAWWLVAATAFLLLCMGGIVIWNAQLRRKVSERTESLKKSEARYSGLLERLNEVIYSMSLPDGQYQYFSPAAETVFGYSSETFMSKPMFIREILHPDFHDFFEKEWAKLLQGYVSHTYEYKITDSEGHERWIFQTNTGVFDENGKIIAIEGCCSNVTARKQAEAALLESEEKYRLLVENANDAIYISQDEVVKFPNPRAVELLDYSEAELAQMPFVNLIHAEDREMVLDRYRKRITGEQPPSTYSFRVIHKSGWEVWVELNSVFIQWEGRPATLNFIRDITQRKKLEARLRHAERMKAIGTLAGGIAHDFNNLLMGIQGRAALMLAETDASHPHFQHLREIEEYVSSASGLTRQILGFAREGKYEVRPTELNTLVRKQNQMFGRTRKEVTIQEKYEENLWVTRVDQGQMEQVLLNLYVNAWQAMPEGGSIEVRTENAIPDARDARRLEIPPGKYVKVSVTDTGTGMGEATLHRIFEPFFSTKETGRGTGLGLASAYGIIRNHGGVIDVQSEKGRGTTFSIYLPASEDDVPEDKRPSEGMMKGTGTILLADDEDIILDVGREMLQMLGYEVITAASGNEAIEICQQHHGKIDLLILDMIMPALNGPGTYQKLREVWPDISVLVSSGYGMDDAVAEMLDQGCKGFLQKPFSMEALSRKIREILADG